MSSALPRSTSSAFRSFGSLGRLAGLRRPSRTVTPPTAHVAEPFHQKSAKEQEQTYLKIAGGKKYLQSSFDRGLKKELKDFEHHQYAQMTTEELYALGKMKYGGTITKMKAKQMATAAFEIAQKYKTGALAPGLNTSKEIEATKRLMKMEHASEPKSEPVKIETNDRLAARQNLLHTQQAPQQSPTNPAIPASTSVFRSTPTPSFIEPTKVSSPPTSHHAASTLVAPTGTAVNVPGAHTPVDEVFIGLGLPIVIHHQEVTSAPQPTEPVNIEPVTYQPADLDQPLPSHPTVQTEIAPSAPVTYVTANKE